MLRYFYIIFLLVCIKWSVSDDRILNQDLDYNNVQNRLVRSTVGRIHKSGSNNRRYRGTSDYEEEDASVAEIDVANFISGDNQEEISDAADEDNSYELQKETDSRDDKSLENDNETPSSLNWNYNINSKLRNADYQNNEELTEDTVKNKPGDQMKRNSRFNREMNIGDLQNVPLKRSRKDDSSDLIDSPQHDNDLPHKHKKKCAIKHMRIPFFSHDKSTKANKKGKKRKFFSFQSKDENKKEINNANKKKQPNNGFTSSSDEVTANIRLEKRSLYGEVICPVCKSVFRRSAPYVPRVRRFDNIVHNSRQFYANNHISRHPKAVEAVTDPEDSLKSLDYLEKRLARQSPSDEEVANNNSKAFNRAQQLRELEEVERRINEISERTRSYDKPKTNY